METKKLYYDDPYLLEFTARVLSCEDGRDHFDVVLDQTAFYPEGGGQGADHGVLGGVRVLDVHEKGGVITHRCASPLTVGSEVGGAIDRARRFDHMQQHSGEHICSGLICERFGCDNVGFHLGAEIVTIDYNADIAWEDLLAIEERANRYIYEDHPISIRTFDGGVPDEIDYRSKKELSGEVRIVAFPGADCCACCGTHVRSSGEVGIVKFLSCQKFREGVRIELLCGERAYRYLGAVWEQARRASQALSVKPTALADAVDRLSRELGEAKQRAAAMEEELFSHVAAQYKGCGSVLLVREEELSSDAVRKLCDAVAAVCGGRCAVFAGSDGAHWKYAMGEPDGDLRALNKALGEALHGRGGGKPFFVQGSVEAPRAAIEAFFARAD